nr:DUF3592 domain-containing protein [uncultured Marinifilum sp.]
MKKKPIKIVSYVFAGVGIILLLFALNGTWNNISFLKDSVETSGSVVDMEAKESTNSDGDYQTYYYPVVEYSDMNGGQHILHSSTGSGQPAYEIGEGIKVLYLPENPSEGKIATFGYIWGGMLVLWILAIVFIGVALLIDFFSKRDQRKQKRAERYSTTLDTEVTEVLYNTSISVNGRSPFQICSQWHDEQSNKIYLFKSKNFWFDPSKFVQKSIKVKVDPRNYKKYWMDTSFIPEMAD